MGKPENNCPICYETLEVIDVAPCDDCGWLETELTHFEEGKHIYCEFDVYGSQLILCDFCDVDFGSYNPVHWGFPLKQRLGLGTSGFVNRGEIPRKRLAIEKGKFCRNCCARLPFLKALEKIRERNAVLYRSDT